MFLSPPPRTIMHLKLYPKLVHSELSLDAVGVQTYQWGEQRRICSGNHGNITGSCLPFSVTSTNMLHRCNATSKNNSSSRLMAGCESDSLKLYQTTVVDVDPLDIWTVIKPGHVREKIAIFASGVEQTGATTSHNGNWDDDSSVVGLLRAVKAKATWEENSSAKRCRRSGNNQNILQNQRTHKLSTQDLDWSPQCGGDAVMVEEGEQIKVSVVEMVAFLEQRFCEQQHDSKPLLTLRRSSTSITLSRAPPTEVNGDESDSIRVSEMVARLESECLRRRAEGALSRSNSLRRTVGRVLLADQNSAPCDASSQSSLAVHRVSRGSTSVSPLTIPTLPCLVTPSSTCSTEDAVVRDSQATPLQYEEAEPLPGFLFLSPPLNSETLHLTHLKPLHPCDSAGESGQRRSLKRRASASQDFLEMRQRLQQLLEPQPYLTVLPHHLLVKIFLLLPTCSLAALKCTCQYFRFIIDTYGVRPADSLWVSDPSYRDDPCKQCKKRYGRGDVSLCRWHHKPFCQALPYGPGYWMCCRGAHKDTPGCNVGLHDNRWVPAFHSINMPIYRRGKQED